MSWQDYVDNQLMASNCVSKAAIAGHDGGVWAKSDNFDVSRHIFNSYIFVSKYFIIVIRNDCLTQDMLQMLYC